MKSMLNLKNIVKVLAAVSFVGGMSFAWGDSAQDVVDQLNTQFSDGGTKDTYSSLSDAGVLLHAWDGSNCDQEGSKACGDWWVPKNQWHHSIFGISSSIVNNSLKWEKNTDSYYGFFYNEEGIHGGLIFATSPEPTVRCLSSGDMSSDSRLGGGCGVQNPNANAKKPPEKTWTMTISGQNLNVIYDNTKLPFMAPKKCSYIAGTVETSDVWRPPYSPSNETANNWLYNSSDYAECGFPGKNCGVGLPSKCTPYLTGGGVNVLTSIVKGTIDHCQGSSPECYNEIIIDTQSIFSNLEYSTKTYEFNKDPYTKNNSIKAFFVVASDNISELVPSSSVKGFRSTCDTIKSWKSYNDKNDQVPLVQFDLKVKEDTTKPTPFSVGCEAGDSNCSHKYKCDQETECKNLKPYQKWEGGFSYIQGDCVQVKPGSDIAGTYMCEQVVFCKDTPPNASSVPAYWKKQTSQT